MKPKPHMRAKVTFLTPEQGGFSRPHCSGIRPQLKVKDDLFTSCIVWADVEDQVFEPGVEYDVSLELLSWEHYRDGLYAGMPLQLNAGHRIVARGTIESIASDNGK
jgi:translation elongation factor EF-Tu-like GTPase